MENTMRTAASERFFRLDQDVLMHHSMGKLETIPGYHWHNGYEIYLFLGGDVRLCIEETYFTPIRGSLFVIRPNELHRVECERDETYERIAIEIRSGYLDELCRNSTDLRACFVDRPLGRENHVTLSEEERDTFILLAHKLMDANNSTSYGHEALTFAAALELLVLTNGCFLAAERIKQGDELPSPVAETMRYIAANLSEDLTLSAIGAAIHYNAGYVSRKFREVTGIPVSKYVMYKRIHYAKKLLAAGTEPRAAARDSGFRDYSVFYRSFIRLSGSAPSSFSGAPEEAGRAARSEV